MTTFTDILKSGIDGLKNTFNFRGSISKKEFKDFAIFYAIYSGLILYFLIDIASRATSFRWAVIIILFGLLLSLIPIISCSVRRFHDTGQSGWKVIIFLPLGFITYAMYVIFLGLLNWGAQLIFSDFNLIFQQPDVDGISNPNLLFTIIGQIFYLIPMIMIRKGDEDHFESDSEIGMGSMGSISVFLITLSIWIPGILGMYGLFSAILSNFKSGILWGLLSIVLFPISFLFPIFLEGNWTPFIIIISSLILKFLLPILISPLILVNLPEENETRNSGKGE